MYEITVKWLNGDIDRYKTEEDVDVSYTCYSKDQFMYIHISNIEYIAIPYNSIQYYRVKNVDNV